MPRRRKDCLICRKRNFVNSCEKKGNIIFPEQDLSDLEKPEDMSSRKRMRSDFDDDGMSSPKRILGTRLRNDQYPMKMFSVHQIEVGNSSEEAGDSNKGECSEEMNDSDEEADPCGVIKVLKMIDSM